jgi:hypothetical protein
MSCAVTADLNRHLAQVDRDSAHSDAVNMLADQWLSHPKRVSQAWETVLTEQDMAAKALQLLSERSLRSGRFSGMSEEVCDSMFLGALDDLMLEAMKDMADGHLESEAEQNMIDAAESAAEDRAYWRDHD